MADVKILSITALQFRLPDDFDGELSDALRLLADYHDSTKGSPGSQLSEIDKSWYDEPWKLVNVKAFDKFINILREGKRLHGLLKLHNCELSDVEELRD